MNASLSFYNTRLEDPKAVYLDAFSDMYFKRNDGSLNISAALQESIKQVKNKYNFGIVFIPEGTYFINKTIYIPKAIRLIGTGKNRPLIILEQDSPGFQNPEQDDKGQANYMFWFTSKLPMIGEEVQDANAGTFYSAISNIDLKIEKGNPAAVALRTHFAQHCFISHMDIQIGDGKAGIFDVGNEIENVRFFGGQYGIYTTKTSPGWPFLMLDTYFEGQQKASIKTEEAGLTILRMNVKNVPTVIEINKDRSEKLFMEDCQFEQISDSAVVISNEENVHTQINLRNIVCKQVAVLAHFRQSGKKLKGSSEIYKVISFTHGNQIEKLNAQPEIKMTYKMEELKRMPETLKTDIPEFPATDTWINLKKLGARGDGKTDDTEIIKDAVEKYSTIYLPQGRYRVTDTIKLRPDTVLIGLNPVATRIILKDNTEAFAGFGEPKPLLEVPEGGNNIVSGIGLDTGGRNPRAVGCKWMGSTGSYMNDVKFIGGHGNMTEDNEWVPVYNQDRTADANPDLKWDSQYWSLWITNQGGGIFKDIWTASPYSGAGLYVSNTSTKGCIYAMSVEHHVRNEVIFRKVANWQVYALQLEEEIAESWNCQPLEIIECNNLIFANFYSFRVIWVNNPYPQAVRTWNSRDIEFLNIHNYAQTKYTSTNTLLDVNTNIEVRPWEIARLYISGKETNLPLKRTNIRSTLNPGNKLYNVEKIAEGFEFIDAVCRDSKGNIYFCDSNWKRIYKWSVGSHILQLITEIQFKPLLLTCDTKDNLLVVVEYFPPVGSTIKGKPEVYPKPADAEGTSFGYWYNTGSTTKVYAIDPTRPDETMQKLELISMEAIEKVEKALLPTNRWRDSNDYLDISIRRPEKYYLAPDGVTVIPDCYDLIRANSLLEAFPGAVFYAVDEYNKRTVRFDVMTKGYLANPDIFVEKGEFNLAVDNDGNVYIPDGQIYIYNNNGEPIGKINVPERPVCLVLGGKELNELYITAHSSLYKIDI